MAPQWSVCFLLYKMIWKPYNMGLVKTKKSNRHTFSNFTLESICHSCGTAVTKRSTVCGTIRHTAIPGRIISPKATWIFTLQTISTVRVCIAITWKIWIKFLTDYIFVIVILIKYKPRSAWLSGQKWEQFFGRLYIVDWKKIPWKVRQAYIRRNLVSPDLESIF